MTLGQRIQALRKQRGMSQEALGEGDAVFRQQGDAAPCRDAGLPQTAPQDGGPGLQLPVGDGLAGV